LALEADGHILEQVRGPLQLECPPLATVFGLGQQPAAALDGGRQAGGQGALVAPQAGPELAGLKGA
jgi:hypothetical protein